jgi:hypothetical protein
MRLRNGILAATLATLAWPLPASATLFKYAFTVEVSQVFDSGSVSFGLAPGDEVQGTVTFDDEGTVELLCSGVPCFWFGTVTQVSLQLGTGTYLHPGAEPFSTSELHPDIFVANVVGPGGIFDGTPVNTTFDIEFLGAFQEGVMPLPLGPFSSFGGTSFYVEIHVGPVSEGNGGFVQGSLTSLQLIPEPATGLLVMTGLLGLAARRQRRAEARAT